jgi:hypothetical protein
MYVLEESDCTIVPMKLPNKEARASAEAVEGRVRTKENDVWLHPCLTQSRHRRVPGPGGVRRAALSERTYRRYLSKVGAVCGSSARTDLHGGRPAMTVPTVTVQIQRP